MIPKIKLIILAMGIPVLLLYPKMAIALPARIESTTGIVQIKR